MLTQGVMATKRMLGTPDPLYYQKTMSIKDQMTDFYESFTRLEREKEVYAPLLVETDLAWERVGQVLAEFPRAASNYFAN